MDSCWYLEKAIFIHQDFQDSFLKGFETAIYKNSKPGLQVYIELFLLQFFDQGKIDLIIKIVNGSFLILFFSFLTLFIQNFLKGGWGILLAIYLGIVPYIFSMYVYNGAELSFIAFIMGALYYFDKYLRNYESRERNFLIGTALFYLSFLSRPIEGSLIVFFLLLPRFFSDKLGLSRKEVIQLGSVILLTIGVLVYSGIKTQMTMEFFPVHCFLLALIIIPCSYIFLFSKSSSVLNTFCLLMFFICLRYVFIFPQIFEWISHTSSGGGEQFPMSPVLNIWQGYFFTAFHHLGGYFFYIFLGLWAFLLFKKSFKLNQENLPYLLVGLCPIIVLGNLSAISTHYYIINFHVFQILVISYVFSFSQKHIKNFSKIILVVMLALTSHHNFLVLKESEDYNRKIYSPLVTINYNFRPFQNKIYPTYEAQRNYINKFLQANPKIKDIFIDHEDFDSSGLFVELYKMGNEARLIQFSKNDVTPTESGKDPVIFLLSNKLFLELKEKRKLIKKYDFQCETFPSAYNISNVQEYCFYTLR